MSKLEKNVLSLSVKTECAMRKAYSRIVEKLKDNSAEGYMDTLIKILIAVVLGVALLAALKTFIIDTFFPELEQQIMDMFTGTGSGAGGSGGAGGTP